VSSPFFPFFVEISLYNSTLKTQKFTTESEFQLPVPAGGLPLPQLADVSSKFAASLLLSFLSPFPTLGSMVPQYVVRESEQAPNSGQHPDRCPLANRFLTLKG
jgi:hypothetical protein